MGLPVSHWRDSSPTRMPQPSWGTKSGKWQRRRMLHGAEWALILDCITSKASNVTEVSATAFKH